MLATPTTHRIAHRPERQSGAALIVGMLMLLVLTVLAISGMNSSSMNLVMAGNTQYSQNAFQAAEAGIERAIAANEFNPDPSLDPEPQNNEDDEDARDVYNSVSRTQLCGEPQPALPGSSFDAFSTFHFEIESSGTSRRDSQARNIQAIAVIAPAASATRAPALPPDCDSADGELGDRLE
jgi:type IV pilus assembly protein PilX